MEESSNKHPSTDLLKINQTIFAATWTIFSLLDGVPKQTG